MFARKNTVMSLTSALVVLSLSNWMPGAHAEAKLSLPQGYFLQGKLIWMPATSDKKIWSEADSYCANTPINGQSGWRLPRGSELKELHASGALNDQGWPEAAIWSSSEASSYNDNHYRLDLRYGGFMEYSAPNSAAAYVTCVNEAIAPSQPEQVKSKPEQVKNDNNSNATIGLKADTSAADKAARDKATAEANEKSTAARRIEQLASEKNEKKRAEEKQAKADADAKQKAQIPAKCVYEMGHSATAYSEADARAQVKLRAEPGVDRIDGPARIISQKISCKAVEVIGYLCTAKTKYEQDNRRGTSCGTGPSAVISK